MRSGLERPCWAVGIRPWRNACVFPATWLSSWGIQRVPTTSARSPSRKRLSASSFPLWLTRSTALASARSTIAVVVLATPGILHLATHGFFLGDGASPQDVRAVANFGALSDDAPAPHPPDPLLRSGLVLSGARASSALNGSGTASSHAGSSLVTALELASLDLWGTQLVVLSACDTGRGDVMLREGIYGLRRAFVVAGAETVVMSLWQVNDDSTRALMEEYYRHLLAGKGRASALRDAMRTLRKARPHPHYWAPFIALGQDAPLRDLAPIPRAQPSLFPLPRHASAEPR